MSRAYGRNEDGTLEITSLCVIPGTTDLTDGHAIVRPTGKQTELRGWPDSKVGIWMSDLGREYLVPAETLQELQRR